MPLELEPGTATCLATSTRLRPDERGAVFTEYVVVLVTVSLVCSLALWQIGPALLRFFLAQRALLELCAP